MNGSDPSIPEIPVITGPFDLLITNGDVVLEDGVHQLDIGVRAGRIAALAPALATEARETLGASGKLVFPGFIDAHTHMGIPIMDTTSADDFASGSIAAAFGGVTTILDFTVQEPGQSLRGALELRRSMAEGYSHVDFGFHINVTNRPLARLDEIPALIAEGFSSFKVFSTYRQAGMMITWEEFEAVLRQVGQHGGLLMLHAEDNDVIESCTAEHLAGDYRHPRYHPRCRPAEAEATAVERAGEIAASLDAPLYIVHLSSRAGLEAGLRAREKGAPIYLETCQYLVLTEAAYERENGHWFITTPPLRTEADAEALWAALAAGQIDVVGTDHCPFTVAQKESGGMIFHRTPNGLPGVETLFPLLYTYGVAEERITLPQLVHLLAANPAQIFGIDHRKGAIRPGADADLVIWDPAVETVLTAEQLHGNADWSPYEGVPVAGKLDSTILRGQFLVREGEFVGDGVEGELLLEQMILAPIRVGANAVIIRDGAILLVEFDDESGPHFNLPGGGLEAGESIHEALQREVREETCAEITVGPLLLVWGYYPPRDNNLYGSQPSLKLIFRCTLKAGSEPRLPDRPDPNEIAVRWVPIAELAGQRLPGAVRLHQLLTGPEPPDLFHVDWSLGLYS